MILTLKQLHPEGSDCTAPYSVEMSKNCTVQEFVECVLEQFPKDWGCIGIEHGRSTFGKPYIEYKYGKITTENRLKDVGNANVMKATSSGGWSRMDYLLVIDDEGGRGQMKMLTDVEQLMQCVLCANDPYTCGCTELDEDESGSCLKYKERGED